MTESKPPSRGDPAALDPGRIPSDIFQINQIALHESPLPPPKQPDYPVHWRTGLREEAPAPSPPAPPTLWDRLTQALGRKKPEPWRFESALETRVSAALGCLCAYAHAKRIGGVAGPDAGDMTALATALWARVRERNPAMSELEDWLERFEGTNPVPHRDSPAPRGIALSPACLLPVGLITLIRNEPMLDYAGSLRAVRGWTGEACAPALAASGFGRWVHYAMFEPLRADEAAIGKAWGQAMAWTATWLDQIGDRELSDRWFAVCRNGALLDWLQGRADGESALAGAVQAALWANWGARSYSEGMEALASLGTRAAPAMPAAGLLLGMSFGREGIPAEWIEATAGLEAFEAELRGTQPPLKGASPRTSE